MYYKKFAKLREAQRNSAIRMMQERSKLDGDDDGDDDDEDDYDEEDFDEAE